MLSLNNGLAKLAEEDPTFTVRTDEQSGQTIISGMGELHLDIIIDRLKREFKVECNRVSLRLTTKRLSQRLHRAVRLIRSSLVVVVSLLVST